MAWWVDRSSSRLRSYHDLEDLPRRPVSDLYGWEEVKADAWFVQHPRSAWAVLPRHASGRVWWKRCWSALSVYLAIETGGRGKGALLTVCLTLAVLGPAAIADADRRTIAIPLTATGYLGLYLFACVTARRIGMVMANRYTEADLEPR
jgi:hypothetical protein